MGCPSFVIIGNNLTFSITCHDPDTGVLSDADDVPDYWIYEDETGVSINTSTPLADVMAKLDDIHSTGFYTETIACTTANGFEDGKTYTIYIEATVDSDKCGISYAFTAYTQLGGMTAGAVTWVYTLTDSDTSAPIDGASIWATTDSAGAHVVASGTTDDAGQVTFYLDVSAAIYIWRSKAGYDFTNPDQESVVA